MHRHSFTRVVTLTTLLALMTSCGEPPSDRAYSARGTPESLIDRSVEVVTLNTATKQDLGDLSTWIARDLPTRAELNCPTSEANCREAERMLIKKNVPVVKGVDSAHAVTLVYERIIARDCNPSFRDHRANFYNTNHPGFGCSIAANIVQHVTDKNEFIAPATLDPASAIGAVNSVRRANTPKQATAPATINQGLVNQARSQ
jgi:hypothetical protein